MTRYRINEIKTDIDVPMSELPALIARKTGIRVEDIAEWEVRRKSIDSRKKPYIQLVYTVDFVTARRIRTNKVHGLSIYDPEKDQEKAPEPGSKALSGRPVVVGMGPAGLFAGLELARMGYRPLIIERGPSMSGRIEAVEKFRRERVLDPEANMLFGEGGAGTFSDGKIGTGIRDGLIRRVLADFRDAGAGDDIMYLAKPHIGTDVLRTVIVNLRHMIEEHGGEVLFDTRLESLLIEDGRLAGIRVRKNPQGRDGAENRLERHGDDAENSAENSSERHGDGAENSAENRSERHGDGAMEISSERLGDDALEIRTNALILAIGHSARDTFAMIHSTGLDMEQKPFSIGVRMEHPQELIDAAQYGPENAGKLPPADYKINYKASNGRGVYSFCMCPGGEVVVCTTKDGELCVNGMSNRKRDSGTANSGILCDVRKEDFGSDDVLAGVRFQEKYERLAFINGGGDFTPPRCTMEEFLGAGQANADTPERSYTDASERSCTDESERPCTDASEHPCTDASEHAQRVLRSLPDFASEAIREAVPAFARKIHGYDDPAAVITAVETRSSSPVRIIRDAHGESNIKGIYPAGEGAGYAGGITSAACDGIRAAWHIIEKYARP